MRSVVSDSDARRRELAKIHILAGELGLDTADRNPESEYRSILWTIGRVRSAGQLDQAGRLALLDHLSKRGRWHRPTQLSGAEHRARKPIVAADRQALIDKLEAQLAAAARPWKYAEAMAQRMFRVERLEWCDGAQLRKIVAALEYDARRRRARAG